MSIVCIGRRKGFNVEARASQAVEDSAMPRNCKRSPVAIIVGTRPEAIKMACVYRTLEARGSLRPVLISTGQHTDLLQSALGTFELRPHHELSVMEPDQSIHEAAAKILMRLPPLLGAIGPRAVLVQGDTTTALIAGLSAFYAHVPVGYIEAGLRTYDLENPFPEESNRQMLSRISRWCFAPTESSRENLLREGIAAERIHVTGNTGIDSLLWAIQRGIRVQFPKPYLLVTLHRRESFGAPLRGVVQGLLDFLNKTPEAHVVWPLHPNPAILAAIQELLTANPRIHVTPPQEYLTFASYLAECKLILTDSGGIQEEAPSLGKRVLIARDTSERPEAIISGHNRLVGRNRQQVCDELCRAWQEPHYCGTIPAGNPFGDGRASERVAEILHGELVTRGQSKVLARGEPSKCKPLESSLPVAAGPSALR